MSTDISTALIDQQLPKSALELELIYQTAQHISQLQNLSELLPRIVGEVSRTFNYNSMGVLLVEPDTNELVVRATIGLEREKHLGFRLPITSAPVGGIVGWVAYYGQAQLVTDVRKSTRYIKTIEEIRSELAVPLKIRDKVIGVIDVQSVHVDGVTEKDKYILTALASQIAIAVENARLYEELREAHNEIQHKANQLRLLLARTVDLQEDERHRIAADIHDSVIQLVYGALYETEGVLHRLPDEAVTSRTDLQNVQTTLKQAVSEIYKAVYDLWPASLDEMGLFPSLSAYLAQFEKDTNINSSLRIHGTPIRFMPRARITIFRLIQEAFHNIRKHAQASRVVVTFKFRKKWIHIQVRDDGVGFDEGQALDEQAHLGLISMRERAENIGGAFKIKSEIGRGTQLAWEFPKRQIERVVKKDD